MKFVLMRAKSGKVRLLRVHLAFPILTKCQPISYDIDSTKH